MPYFKRQQVSAGDDTFSSTAGITRKNKYYKSQIPAKYSASPDCSVITTDHQATLARIVDICWKQKTRAHVLKLLDPYIKYKLKTSTSTAY